MNTAGQDTLDAIVVGEYPALKELCWSYHLPTISGQDALSQYERNWRSVDKAGLTPKEKDLIARLTETFGNGCFLG